MGLLTKDDAATRDVVFIERERHAYCREGNVGYPCRAIRTREHLYIRNFRPERWPAGDPDLNGVQGAFGDIDRGPTKATVLAGRDDKEAGRWFDGACGKRPAEELYLIGSDPWQLTNLADDPQHAAIKAELRGRLDRWMAETGDPRAGDGAGGDVFDTYPYHSKEAVKRMGRPQG